MTMFSLFLAATGLAYFAGRGEAGGQEDYLITNTSPEMVVLRVYGDNLICAPFDRSTKEVQRQFKALKLAEDSKLTLNLEKVGPLKRAEKPLELSPPTPTATPVESPSVTPTLTPSPVTSTPDASPEPKGEDTGDAPRTK